MTQAKTYTTAPKTIRAVYVPAPGTYDIDGVKFEADHTHVGYYFSVSLLGDHHNLIRHSPNSFRREWDEVK